MSLKDSSEAGLDYIRARRDFLTKVIKQKELSIRRAPTGRLKGTSHGRKWQYCYKEGPGNAGWHYIRKKDMGFAGKIAQRIYDEKVVELSRLELKALARLEKLYLERPVDQAYAALPASLRQIVTPVRQTDEQIYDRWMGQKFEKKPFFDDENIFLSANREKMRSKTEVIIADMMLRHNIPYIYEKPLMLKGLGIVYPDFTLYDFEHQREIYWEHFGLFDDRYYRENALSKITTYQNNGYFLGDQLIITFETARQPLKISYVENELQRLKCCVYRG